MVKKNRSAFVFTMLIFTMVMVTSCNVGDFFEYEFKKKTDNVKKELKEELKKELENEKKEQGKKNSEKNEPEKKDNQG